MCTLWCVGRSERNKAIWIGELPAWYFLELEHDVDAVLGLGTAQIRNSGSMIE